MSDNLLERLEVVESELKKMKELKENKTTKPDKPDKPEKPKVVRKPTEYNKFMSNFIKEKKEELGDEFKHKVAFSDGAKAWKVSKETKESE